MRAFTIELFAFPPSARVWPTPTGCQRKKSNKNDKHRDERIPAGGAAREMQVISYIMTFSHSLAVFATAAAHLRWRAAEILYIEFS
jgi:hypothetical protein